MNDEWEKMWKDVVVVSFRHFLGRNEENHEKICQDIRSPGRYLNPAPSEYEAGVLTTQARLSVPLS
jgi:hypothetical protein